MADRGWRLRLRLAHALDRWCRASCWDLLVTWAFWPGRRGLWDALRGGRACRAEAARDGCCYCGKFRREATP